MLKQYMSIFCVKYARKRKKDRGDLEIIVAIRIVQICIPSPKYNHSSFVLKNTDLPLT